MRRRVPQYLQKRVAALESVQHEPDEIPPAMWAPKFLPLDEWEQEAMEQQRILIESVENDTAPEYPESDRLLYPVGFGSNRVLERLAETGIRESSISDWAS